MVIVRVLAAAVLVAIGLVLLVLAWPSLFDLAGAPIVAQVVALRGLTSVIAVLGALVFAIVAILWRGGRRFFASLAVMALAFTAVNAAVLASRGFGNDVSPSPVEGEITVLSWNTLGDAPGADGIARLVAEKQADIVVLPETSAETAESAAVQLRESGRPMWVYTVAFDQIAKARSTSVLVSAAIGEYEIDRTVGNTAVLPSVVLRPLGHDGPTVIGVHPVSPVPAELPRWREDLAWLDDRCQGERVIMAGDFNATVDHFTATPGGPALGACVDAAVVAGSGAVGTWPTSLPPILGAPINHVVTTPDIAVLDFDVITTRDDAGSDHRPVVARVVL
ncbi:endonuclease/exonuclease/phosphatase family protein [Microcella flavibacter]|uniref:endonuclease/exonuclease/phosphatase family protein n=1 Tax=Microcella flavibacter TaxID=1804990 RepID=UPI001E4F1E82|nr:endonuclease/exonuclease/phosphatase family protein [Microcella flavibacter]